jgi:hypothetical protein
MQKILLSCIGLLFIACVNPQPMEKIVGDSTIIEPEAYVYECLISNPYSNKRSSCINNNSIDFYPKQKSIKLASLRGEDIKHILNLKGKTRILLSVDVYSVDLPINLNVDYKPYKKNNKIILDINVQDIKNSIIIFDATGKKLINYTVIK